VQLLAILALTLDSFSNPRPKKETLERRRSALKAEQAARRGVRGAARQALGDGSKYGGSGRGGKSPGTMAGSRGGKRTPVGGSASGRRTPVPKQRGVKFK
jgi:hypothetical protein